MSLKTHESIPMGITVEPKECQPGFVSYLSFTRLCITDATSNINLLNDKIRSNSNVFSKLKTPIFFDGYWFDGNVESIDPLEVESVSFFVNEGLQGVKDGNRIISIYSKKAKAG
jgi:hypothetical protein